MVLLLALHPQIVYWGAVFPLGFDVINATYGAAENHGQNHSQDLDEEDGKQGSQYFIAVLFHHVQYLLGAALRRNKCIRGLEGV